MTTNEQIVTINIELFEIPILIAEIDNLTKDISLEEAYSKYTLLMAIKQNLYSKRLRNV